MARKKKHEEHEEHANHERWVLSYADILTLLLALFIVMFAISKVDQKKFEEFSRGTAESFGQANLALQGETGTLSGSDGIMSDQKPGQDKNVPADDPAAAPAPMAQAALQKQQAAAAAAQAEKANLEKLKADLAKQLKAAGLDKAIQFQLDERGLVVNIVTDKVLFDTGAADLKPGGVKVLDTIAPMIRKLPNAMTVEGHTDNVPISGRYSSNWALSSARATTVLERLLVDGIPSKRISAAGYADQRPIATNVNDTGRSRNRRVAVVILPTVALTGDSAGTKAPTGAAAAPIPEATGAPSVVDGATPAPAAAGASSSATPAAAATTITSLDQPAGPVVTPGH
ncbi:flagellar motor protein MotB [Agilicoccus flavus]|uniref:flagellar motor protein MotB n=1 Tax=Agilicoccus flavus TaxID=2775968 RepID=UPI001CF67C17|nr:flagellar motor protein MotB [Agilicoccus flavus]